MNIGAELGGALVAGAGCLTDRGLSDRREAVEHEPRGRDGHLPADLASRVGGPEPRRVGAGTLGASDRARDRAGGALLGGGSPARQHGRARRTPRCDGPPRPDPARDRRLPSRRGWPRYTTASTPSSSRATTSPSATTSTRPLTALAVRVTEPAQKPRGTGGGCGGFERRLPSIHADTGLGSPPAAVGGAGLDLRATLPNHHCLGRAGACARGRRALRRTPASWNFTSAQQGRAASPEAHGLGSASPRSGRRLSSPDCLVCAWRCSTS